MLNNNQSYFISFRGMVREISILNDNKNYWNYLLVENEDGSVANLITTPETYFAYKVMITVGSVITGYFPANAPVPLIYPPQYLTTVIVPDPLWQNIKVDYFDENLVSMDGTLKLNIENDTSILNQDGTPYVGSLGNQLLVVYYGASTRSIPAITTPSIVVVLDKEP